MLATLNKTNLTSTAFQENPLQWSSCNCLWKCLDSNVESYLICPPRHCPQWPPIKWGLVVKDLWKSFAILYHEHVILYLQSNYDSAKETLRYHSSKIQIDRKSVVVSLLEKITQKVQTSRHFCISFTLSQKCLVCKN